MRRVLCLWLPNWPIQRFLVAEPALERRIVVLTSEVPGRGEVVSARNERARRRGIDPGMPVSEARTLLPRHETLQAMPWRPDADRQALTQLALRCERFSPCVGLEESEHAESVLLEVTGVAHLFSGEASFVAQVERDVAEQYPSVRLALADSVGAAWAAVHFLTQRQQPVAIVPPGRPEVLWPLPVEGLRLSAANVRALKRLGITTVGQVFQLDRASLPARFGPEINRRWAQLLGERDERITACRARPTFQVSRILDEATTHGEAIEQLWSSLLERLVESLRTQQQGVLHLRCQWLLKGRHAVELEGSSAIPVSIRAPVKGRRIQVLWHCRRYEFQSAPR